MVEMKLKRADGSPSCQAKEASALSSAGALGKVCRLSQHQKQIKHIKNKARGSAQGPLQPAIRHVSLPDACKEDHDYYVVLIISHSPSDFIILRTGSFPSVHTPAAVNMAFYCWLQRRTQAHMSVNNLH